MHKKLWTPQPGTGVTLGYRLLTLHCMVPRPPSFRNFYPMVKCKGETLPDRFQGAFRLLFSARTCCALSTFLTTFLGRSSSYATSDRKVPELKKMAQKRAAKPTMILSSQPWAESQLDIHVRMLAAEYMWVTLN